MFKIRTCNYNQFRVAARRHPGDSWFAELIVALTEASPRFRDWWARPPWPESARCWQTPASKTLAATPAGAWHAYRPVRVRRGGRVRQPRSRPGGSARGYHELRTSWLC